MEYLRETKADNHTHQQATVQKEEAQPKQEELTPEATQHIENVSKQTPNSGNPIEGLMESMMGTMSTFLGSTKGSKLTGKLGLNVPIATGCNLTLSLQAEQEEKMTVT